MPEALVNGVATDCVAAGDRGLHYGDGLFETIAWRDGRPRLWDYHYRRLAEGCRRLGMARPQEQLLLQEMHSVAAGAAAAVIKLVLTRAPGGRGYRPAPDATTHRVVLRSPWPEHIPAGVDNGAVLRYCDTRLGRNPRLAGIKHLNRLEQVLARSEWGDEFDEGLMQDETGSVIEGTMSNLFACREGAIVTPDLSQCGVAGVVRQWIMDTAARSGMALTVTAVTPDLLAAADELFITNSLIGVRPVRRLGEQEYGVGTITRRLQDALRLESD